MANATYTVALGGNTKLPATSGRKSYVLEQVFDAAVQNLAAGESVSLINIPAKTLVKDVVVVVETVEAANDAFGIGDSASATQFLSAVAANALAASKAAATTDKYYPAANDIRLTGKADAATTALKVRVKATLVDYSDQV
jgi:hypothetical protein